jgi:hypothetical protein
MMRTWPHTYCWMAWPSHKLDDASQLLDEKGCLASYYCHYHGLGGVFAPFRCRSKILCRALYSSGDVNAIEGLEISVATTIMSPLRGIRNSAWIDYSCYCKPSFQLHHSPAQKAKVSLVLIATGCTFPSPSWKAAMGGGTHFGHGRTRQHRSANYRVSFF